MMGAPKPGKRRESPQISRDYRKDDGKAIVRCGAGSIWMMLIITDIMSNHHALAFELSS